MKLSSRIIAKILTLCGISLTCTACYGVPPPDMYGSPYADFEVKGMVTDSDGDPIEGIKVALRPYAEDYELGAAITDTEGEYTIQDRCFESDAGRLDVVAEDIDGDENGGNFASVIKNIPVELSDHGQFQKTVNFILKLETE